MHRRLTRRARGPSEPRSHSQTIPNNPPTAQTVHETTHHHAMLINMLQALRIKHVQQQATNHSAFARDPSNYMRLRQNASAKKGRACKGTRRARCADVAPFQLPVAPCAMLRTAQQLLLQPSRAWPSSPSAALARRLGQPERPARQHAGTPVPHASVRRIGHFAGKMTLSAPWPDSPAARRAENPQAAEPTVTW